MTPSPLKNVQRRLARVASTAIAEARDGQPVRVVGTLDTDLWHSDGRCCASMTVQDATGVARIIADGIMLAPAPDAHRVYGALGPIPERALEYLDGLGENLRAVDDALVASIYEGVLLQRTSVAVCGLARWQADQTGVATGYRDVARALTLEAAGTVDLIMGNDPRTRR